jgi:hypothetical protein
VSNLVVSAISRSCRESCSRLTWGFFDNDLDGDTEEAFNVDRKAAGGHGSPRRRVLMPS